MSNKKKHQSPEPETQETVQDPVTEETGAAEETAAEAAETVADEPEVLETEPAELGELRDKVADLTDSLKRSMAEFDNFRKRSDKEKAARFDMGVRSVVERILPVLDNFERGLSGLSEEQAKDPFADGMAKTYKQMSDMLSELGVAPIEAVGKTFNPDLHNAVMHIEDETVDENIVVEEFQKGYTLNGTVVRYSMVKVAN